MAADRKVRWALVGTSEFAADWIAPAIAASERASLVAVVSRDRARARVVAARFKAEHHATSLAELGPDAVDAVHLVVPNQLHLPLTVEAARRGLHVLVEKPMASSTTEARAMVQAAREAGVVLAVGHCMAWAPPIVAAQQLIDAGRIGRPVLATIAVSFDSPPAGTWRQETTTEAGGGPLQDLGSHAVDALLRLLGPAVRVVGTIGRVRYDYPADDTATLLIQFASGAQAAVQTAFTCTQNDLVIQGTEGRLTSREWLGRDFAGDLSWEPSGVGIGRFDELQVMESGQSIELARVNVYGPQVDEVSRSILEGTPLRIDGERELAVVAVLEAGIESARHGCAVELGGSNP